MKIKFQTLRFKFLYQIQIVLSSILSTLKSTFRYIIHIEQCSQYTSYEYKAICESKEIQISMSREETPIDYSPIESGHSFLKKDTLYNNDITPLQEYIDLVEDWIKLYNTTRLKNAKK